MKVNKQAIKDAIKLLKDYEMVEETFLKQSDSILENLGIGRKYLAPIIAEKNQRLIKTKTSIAQLSMMLYSK